MQRLALGPHAAVLIRSRSHHDEVFLMWGNSLILAGDVQVDRHGSSRGEGSGTESRARPAWREHDPAATGARPALPRRGLRRTSACSFSPCPFRPE